MRIVTDVRRSAAEKKVNQNLKSYSYNFCSSKSAKLKLGNPAPEVNTRLVYAMRCIGKGAEAARMFCGIMNLPPPPTKFSKYNKMLLGATKDVCDATMKDAVKEAVQENQNIRDISVAVDGTWQKRIFLREWCCDSYECGHRKGN
ncbi:uncharacterized protein TNCV_4969211 [Trichonephila clavipes]|nr:uncharacterized protein TNCV_4969211 [Trichonephila clavipes]